MIYMEKLTILDYKNADIGSTQHVLKTLKGNMHLKVMKSS